MGARHSRTRAGKPRKKYGDVLSCLRPKASHIDNTVPRPPQDQALGFSSLRHEPSVIS